MQVVFVSNYFNHHQLSFCDALYELLEGSFCFLQTQPMEEERVKMGWQAEERPYVRYVQADDTTTDGPEWQTLLLTADVVIFGGCDDESYIRERLAAGKPIFRYNERLYKEGQWKDFMGMYKPEILKSKLFSVYLKHRKDAPASYVYLTLPATTQQKVRDFDSRSVHIIRNDKKAQAAVINDLCYASVYHPTNLLIDNDNPIAISEPGTYIIHIKKKEIVSHESFALQLTNK